MGLLDKLFGGSKRTAEDKFNESVVKLFRDLDKTNGALQGLSDGEIAKIATAVMATFEKVSERRGEQIPPESMGMIVMKFLLVYKTHGHNLYLEHLKYELDRYIEMGLREDYK